MNPTETAAAILACIEAEPHRHDQAHWKAAIRDDHGNVCGTTMCVAGWAAHLHGWEFGPGDMGGTRLGVIRSIASIGRDALGLCPAAADRLFHDATNDGAIRVLHDIADGEDPDIAVSRSYALD